MDEYYHDYSQKSCFEFWMEHFPLLAKSGATTSLAGASSHVFFISQLSLLLFQLTCRYIQHVVIFYHLPLLSSSQTSRVAFGAVAYIKISWRKIICSENVLYMTMHCRRRDTGLLSLTLVYPGLPSVCRLEVSSGSLAGPWDPPLEVAVVVLHSGVAVVAVLEIWKGRECFSGKCKVIQLLFLLG